MFLLIFEWLNTNLFSQTGLLLGLIAVIGLTLQKKNVAEILEGFVTTVLGVFIFTVGIPIVGSSASLLGNLLKPALGVTGGVIGTSNTVFTGMALGIEYLAARVPICFIVTWFIHVLLVKLIKKLKVVYLTMQNVLSLTSCFYFFFYTVMGYTGLLLDVLSGGFTLLYITLFPMLTYKDSMAVTDGSFALGHFNHMSAWIGGKLSSLFGDSKKSAEDLTLPGWFKNFGGGGLSIAVALPITYIVVWLIIVIGGNAEALTLLTETAGQTNSLIFMFLSAIQFTAGIYILLYGIKMFLGSLVPAFQGVSQKFLPHAAPGVDNVAFYAMAPKSVTITMISYMVGTVLVSIGCIVFKTPIFIVFNLIAAFFESCSVGAIANHKGGWKGCIVTGFVIGVVSTISMAFFTAGMGILEKGVAQINLDPNAYPAAVYYLFRLIYNK